MQSISAQLSLLKGAHEGPEMKKSRLQALAVSASCLFYLIPSFSYFALGDPMGGWIYINVTFWSVLADGSWMPIHRRWHIRICDKWSATTAGIYTFIILVTAQFSIMLLLAAVSLTTVSLYFLKLSRGVGSRAKRPGANSDDIWQWVIYHSAWHLVSGVSVALGAYVALLRETA
mmetsp:Transcript_32979/g.61330  ORF Transcript_32979/g.61330 Transcript_32979/m.61330 type:complete len:174 (-) Transcript_32979:54-575(-)